MSNTSMQTLRRELTALRANGQKWWEIGYRYPNVKFGTLSRIVNDQNYEPKNNAIRHALGLQPHTVAVEPLPCGCPPSGTRCKVHGQPRSTTPNATRKRSKRIEAMRAAVKLTQSLYMQS